MASKNDVSLPFAPCSAASPHKSRVAERFLAHARLYRHMAGASIDEAVGELLLQKADRCVRDAAAANAAD